jgi:soluble lytic murein transglycosylase-like protein
MATQSNTIKATYIKQLPQDVDMDRIYQIESSGDPNAVNNVTGARGLGQIMPGALKEYNHYNKANIQPDQLFVPQINHQISVWYMNRRIPQMLNHYGVPDTEVNRVAAYHAGAHNVARGRIGPATQDYITKYNQLGQGDYNGQQ